MDGIGVTAQADEWNKWGRTQLNTATTLVKCVSVCQVIVFHKRIFKKAALALIIVQMHLISFFGGRGKHPSMGFDRLKSRKVENVSSSERILVHAEPSEMFYCRLMISYIWAWGI